MARTCWRVIRKSEFTEFRECRSQTSMASMSGNMPATAQIFLNFGRDKLNNTIDLNGND